MGSGIDIRGDGGYIVAAPSIHPDTGQTYRWSSGRVPVISEMADAPSWMVDLALRASEKPFQPIPDRPSIVRPYLRPEYGLTALREECEKIERSPNGEQEFTLNMAGFRIGQLVGEGVIDYQIAFDGLLASALRNAVIQRPASLA